ncbi:hypothetical protein GCM10025734_21860 [Kitasatospora paranensis]
MTHPQPIPPPEKPEAPGVLREHDGALEWHGHLETLRLEPWGADAIRVRAVRGGRLAHDLPGALLDEAPPSEAVVKAEGSVGRIVNGRITAEVTDRGIVRFLRADGSELLSEQPAHFWWPGARLYTPTGNGYHRLEQRFAAYDGERLYGLGQHQHGLFDQKGATVDLVQRNAEVSIPVLLSDRGYLLLWNNPAIGRVELAVNGTRWVADSARQFDYWITAGAPAETLARYADATGHSPRCPPGRPASGSASCATAPRTNCWTSPASTSAVACRSRSSSTTSSTGPTSATGAWTPPSGPIPPRWCGSWPTWACA